MLHLHPAKHGKFIERLVKLEEKRKRNFLKKNFKKHLPVKNKFSTFAPALRNNSKQHKKEIHVRRHIELTAVLREISKQKNKSNGIGRFEENR